MLYVWWYWKSVVFIELLLKNQTNDSDACCRQLNKLNAAVEEKRPELVNRKGVIFHHDNAIPMMLHPPYSPDLAPSDYYLFRCLQNSLNG